MISIFINSVVRFYCFSLYMFAEITDVSMTIPLFMYNKITNGFMYQWLSSIFYSIKLTNYTQIIIRNNKNNYNLIYSIILAAKHQINEEFKKNKSVSDPVVVQNVWIQFNLNILYYTNLLMIAWYF